MSITMPSPPDHVQEKTKQNASLQSPFTPAPSKMIVLVSVSVSNYFLIVNVIGIGDFVFFLLVLVS